MTLAPDDATLETERLTLRPITRDDLPFFTRIQADPDVARFIGQGRPRTDAESLEWLEATLLSYNRVRLGQLAAIRKSDGVLIGRCGLSHLEIERAPFAGDLPRACQGPACSPAGLPVEILPELGYTFDRAAWGQGFAREATAAVFAYATKTLHLKTIVSLIHPENARSLRLAKTFGVEFVDRVRTGDMTFDRYRWP